MSYPRYPKYKDSGVEWLGEVPEGWGFAPIWSLFRRTKATGYAEEELLSVYRDYGVVPKSSRDDNNNNPSEDLSPYQLVVRGDMVINKMKAWQGSVAISQYRGIVSPAYFVYTAIHSANSEYLHYLLRSEAYICAYFSVSKGIRINQWDLDSQYHSRLPVLLPSTEEQQAIAAFLDHETAKIDALIAEQEKLVTLLREKRQAVISHAVTKGLNPDAPMKDSGVEWLGEVPEGWRVERIKDIAQITGGGTPPKDRLDYWLNGEIPWVSPKDMKRLVIYDSEDYITEAAVHGSATNFVEPGMPLLVVRSGILRHTLPIAIAGCKLTINQDMKAFSLTSRMLACFLMYWIIGNNSHLILEWGQIGATVESVDVPRMMNTGIPCPPLSEQQSIVEYLDAETTKIDALIAEADKAIELLKERRSAIISAAVTGKIDVRNIPLQEAV